MAVEISSVFPECFRAFRLAPEDPINGCMNNTTHFIWYTKEGGREHFIWRSPAYERSRTFDCVKEELLYAGFLTAGGSIRIRSIAEQANIISQMETLSIPVISPLFIHTEGILFPYLEIHSFKDYLCEGDVQATGTVFDNILKAHKHNIILGDCWTTNTHIKDDGTAVEFDFDFELGGEYAKEFDIAKLLYHTLHFAKDRQKILDYLTGYFSNHKLTGYDFSMISLFVRNYANHHRTHPTFQGKYEDVDVASAKEIDQLLGIILH